MRGGGESLIPIEVTGITNAVSVSAGGFYYKGHTCAVLRNGKVKCWGNNEFGQLGDGTTEDKSTPVDVNGITNAVSISSGDNHTCALLDTNKIKCWGYNEYGQLGDGTGGSNNSKSLVPVDVNGIDNAISVSAGRVHTCALLDTNKIKCWGYNEYGQLGIDPSFTTTVDDSLYD